VSPRAVGTLLDAARAGERLDAERAAGRRIVFTNGCFDLLHVGHVRLLSAARALGDLLVVGINADESVRRLKGPGRPILPLEQRAELLAALRAVDLVVAFSEDTPLELIRRLRPDVLVKGGDWSPEQVVGREVVEAAGGQVVIVPLVEGSSTTALVRRLRGA
jgi:rfaE bifunctional protein nucleotidyltransferase chain/domain